MAKGPLLAEVNPGEPIVGVYLLASKEVGTTKNGSSFGKLALSDPSARLEARLWDRAEELLADLAAGQAVEVTGRIDSFRGQKQIIVESLAPAQADPADFLPQSPIPAEELWQRFGAALRKVRNQHLKQILDAFFSDQDFRNRFGKAPAAKAAHHAYVGGLLEHTSSLATMAVAAAAHYTHLDRDLLITGALLHDVGKVDELTLGPPLDYTDQGRLLGHLVIGIGMLDQRLGKLKKFPPALADQLRHLIASHHGQELFGSPTKPKTAEAVVLHLLDDLDAKTAMVAESLAQRPDDLNGWTNFNRLLERHLYAPGDDLYSSAAPERAKPAPEDQPEPEDQDGSRPPSLFDA